MKKITLQSKATTVVGSVFGFGGVILSLLPEGVRDTCVAAISDSDNPLTIAIMVVAGLILTVIGPSLAPSKKTDQGQ